MAKKPDNAQQSGLWHETVKAMSLGWDLAIPIFAGVLGGHVLDRWLGTDYIFTIGLLFLGIFVSYYNLARFIQKQNQQSRSMDKENKDDKGGT